jgi:hypothetical protein
MCVLICIYDHVLLVIVFPHMLLVFFIIMIGIFHDEMYLIACGSIMLR